MLRQQLDSLEGPFAFRLLARLVLLMGLALPMRAPAANGYNSVYLSEFLVEAPHNTTDKAQERGGWIELYNGGFEEANLRGWFLSDEAANLTKWRFPEVGIPPGGFLLVFATGEGRTTNLAHLETNFRLNQDGGFLALSGPRTNLVSAFAPYPSQTPNVSYGRAAGVPEACGYLSEPTPGRPNQSHGPGFAPRVTFSTQGGSFIEPFLLDLSCHASNVVIRYTVDGRLPGQNSRIYTRPISITNSLSVRARAFGEGLMPGPPAGETYLFLATNVLKFSSTLPVLIMDTLGLERSTSSRSSSVQLSFYEPLHGRSLLTQPPSVRTRGGYHVRGSTSADMPQPGFAVQFLDELDHEQHLAALGLPANSDWVLYAPTVYDPIMIHNPFVHQLSRDMGHYSPRTRFIEAFLVRHPGPITLRDYYGIYVLEEKIKVGRHRVAIDRLGAEDVQMPEVSGGYLLKFDRLGPGESGLWAGGAGMAYVEPKESLMRLPQRAPQREFLTAYLDQFSQALRSQEWKDPNRGYRAYIDVPAWIDFHVLEVLSGNVDALKFSTYFYKPRNGKITYGPHWDFDRALGSIDDRDADPRRWNTGRFFDAPWWGRLFRDPDFWQLWVDRWQDLRRAQFSETNLFNLVDRLTDEVRPAQPRQVRRWGLEPRGGTYQSEVDWMKSWLSQRLDFIDDQLVQPPQLSLHDGRVAPDSQLLLTGPSGATIYYTLDGSDPRSPQGAISSQALVYDRPIQLQADAKVVARARDPQKRQTGGPPTSTPWSSPASASYAVAPR